jgi:hypothetical protein
LLTGVYVNDNPITYDRYEDHIYCDAVTADVVIADYIYAIGEQHWPAHFTKVVVSELASAFAAAITQDASMASHFTEVADKLMRQARWADSSSQTARNLDMRSPLVRKRFV